MDAIKADHLRKTFGHVTAVDDVSIDIPEGGIFGFLGPNGAGKTTTIRMITGVLVPDAGSVLVLGTDVQKDPLTAKLKMGVIPENGTVYSDLTAEQNILITGKFFGMSRTQREERASEILDRLGLTERRDDIVRTFSKGMRQRISIACAIVHSPPVLILDEPTRGIDVGAKAEIHNLIGELVRKNIAVIMISSELPEILGISDRIIVIHEGELTAELDYTSATEEKIMLAATGTRQ